MIGAIVSPIKLNVSPHSFELIYEFLKGENKGKFLYINPYYVKSFCKYIVVEKHSYEEFTTIYRNEIEATDNFELTSDNWISNQSTRIFSLSEAQDFQQVYELSESDGLFKFLEENKTEHGNNLASVILMAGIDIILDYEKRSKENGN